MKKILVLSVILVTLVTISCHSNNSRGNNLFNGDKVTAENLTKEIEMNLMGSFHAFELYLVDVAFNGKDVLFKFNVGELLSPMDDFDPSTDKRVRKFEDQVKSLQQFNDLKKAVDGLGGRIICSYSGLETDKTLTVEIR